MEIQLTEQAAENLLALVRDVWVGPVQEDYRNNLIISERELQACFYGHLRQKMEGHSSVRLFVEPSVRANDDERALNRRPDLIIAQACAEGDASVFEVLAVIELKLDRGSYIKFEGELDRIEALGGHAEIFIENQRPDRKTNSLRLRLTPATHFFLGFVGSADAKAVHPDDVRRHDKGFAARNVELASRTTLLYGRVDKNSRIEFGDALFRERTEI